ncbi:MAG: hypothetical protein LBT50_00675 [Prevotellaceae bacterium]|jgi:hypothetical protein|nr:hypothetical protein [Prevotellaceae bacterium]
MGQAPLLVVVVMVVTEILGLLPTMGLAPFSATKPSPNAKKTSKNVKNPKISLLKIPKFPQKSPKNHPKPKFFPSDNQ